MTEEVNMENSNTAQNSTIKQEINLQFHWYMLVFFIIFYGSLIIPGLIFIYFLFFFYIPYFLESESLIAVFIQMESLIVAVLLPLIIIICYFIRLFLVALITRILWRLTEKRSPSKEGTFPRNIQSKAINYYHLRSFMIKYPKNMFTKAPFPWLLRWFYNYVGSNQIGKGTVIEEQFGADKFVEIGENSYIGVNSGFSSHSLEGIFGRISFFKIKLGNNVTTAGLNCIAPGVEINENSYLLPLASATKHTKLKGNNYYFGVPLRKIFKKKILNYLKISEEDLNRDKQLREKSN